MGPLYQECVLIAVNSSDESVIQNEDDLQSKASVIAVGPDGSGSAVTWDYMRQLEEGYKKAAVKFEGGVRALSKVAASPTGDINAFLFTMKPDPNNKMFQSVTTNPKLKSIDVDDKDLNDKYELTGKPIYEFRTIPVTGGLFKTKVTVPCVDALIVASTELDEDSLERLADLVMNYKTSFVKE